ncbi:MAG: aromatic amino acid hydroxylase [Bdellovibrionaceae bacterium]|nr:aromatic amino acid hydroxylase [Pseudobdellovibrionaceae bacterium]
MKQTYAEVLKSIPAHLQQYIVEQDYSRYTPIDQATWRFSLRQLKNFLSKNAYDCYVEGLKKTGISVEEIPHIHVMCEKLQEFGWYALPVSGFIPPAAFMELQSLNILPIASDMRTVDHILYTPAPDIVHEAAGHAPILVDPDFANYLKSYAQVAKKAIISSEDLAQYEAIRDLSDIKENPSSTREDIQRAEKKLADVNKATSHVSEAALLGRMNWWTAEYGLIGDVSAPKIFGAGLLSSVGEARSCLTSGVEKIPLTVDCIDQTYDITEKQPQLFVAKSFEDLGRVLSDLENRMAFRLGGVVGLERAKTAKTVNTVQFNSGLQVSGKLTEFSVNSQKEITFIKFEGPCQLSVNEHELPAQGKEQHPHGFSSPLGLLKNSSVCLSTLSKDALLKLGIATNSICTLEFISGITVTGLLKSETRILEKLVLLSFENCTVKDNLKILFEPAWGTFDMAIGTQVISVFGGPADRKAYGISDSFVQKIIPRKKFTALEDIKHSIYTNIRKMRENKTTVNPEEVHALIDKLKTNAPNEWLAFLEILELSHQIPSIAACAAICTTELERIRAYNPEKSEFIELGLALAHKVV